MTLTDSQQKDVVPLVLLGGFVFVVVGIVAGPLVDGYVLTRLWQWFVSEPFNVRTLSYWHAVGLMGVLYLSHAGLAVTTNAIWSQTTKDTKAQMSRAFGSLISRVGAPLLVLLLGYFAHRMLG